MPEILAPVICRPDSSEELYHFAAIVESSDDAILSKDLNGIIRSWNTAAERIFGYTAPEVIGNSVTILIPPGHENEESHILSRIRRGEKVEHYETVRQRKDGSLVDISLSVSPIKDADGRIIGASKIARDISERKRTEEALRASEERFRILFNLSPVAIYSIDTSGVIQNFNRRAAELWGRQPTLGDTDQRFCGSFKMFRPDGTYMPHEQCPMAEVVSGKIPAANDAEVNIERPDGSCVTVIVNIRPLKGEQGEITGAINCFYDITERKQAEEALRRGMAFDEAVMTNMAEGLYTVDAQGAVTYMNPAAEKMFGWTLDELRGKRMHDMTHHHHPDGTPFPVEECAGFQVLHQGKTVSGYEDVFIRKDGSFFPVVYSSSPICENETVTGLVVVFRDITDRKRTEEQLALAQAQLAGHATQLEQLVAERTTRLQETIAELEHFSYTITHDMRAPLRAMQGYGGMLLDQTGDRLTSESTDYLRRITEAAQRMDALITDSLQYAKVVRDRIPLYPVEPTRVLRGILESYPTLRPPHAEIELVEPLPPVIANDTGLGQCFSNLLGNAIKFVKSGKVPHVRIWTETRGDFVRFWFEDNGIGIPKQYQERIFDMFQQLDKGYEGTGIGLALVRKTAERMDGKVGVESEPGQGSRFWLELKHAKPSIL